ncbi:MAG: enolase C-terminal domain-like protein [Candidatus Velthaea sp.]
MNVRDMSIRAVDVPMRRPLGTSAQTIATAPLLLIDLRTDEGIVGRAYLFCYSKLGQRLMRDVLADAAMALSGLEIDPARIGEILERRYRLVGPRGVIGMAIAGIDVALWDALALAANVPLAEHLGATLAAVPAYNSNGLGLIGAEAAGTQAVELVAEGFRCIKLRLGYPTLEEDIATVHAVKRAIGPEVEVIVDYNQCLDITDALRRGAALDAEGIGWIEEPIVHDDLAACAQLAARITTPVQLGENFQGPHALHAAIAARASDLVMFDLERIGGVSGWLSAARMAAAAALPVSSHLFPEVSVHLLAATPTRDRLEVVDWANPILAEPIRIDEGMVRPANRPGTGVAWDEDAVRRYLV